MGNGLASKPFGIEALSGRCGDSDAVAEGGGPCENDLWNTDWVGPSTGLRVGIKCSSYGLSASVSWVRVVFTKLSDERHSVRVERANGTTDLVELDSRSFLRHDLSHLAVETELGLAHGVWGCVAAGGSLDGGGLAGEDMFIAETISGPMQTLMRTGGGVPEVLTVLRAVAPTVATTFDLAERIHDRLRTYRGHWKATPYGGEMAVEFPEPSSVAH